MPVVSRLLKDSLRAVQRCTAVYKMPKCLVSEEKHHSNLMATFFAFYF